MLVWPALGSATTLMFVAKPPCEGAAARYWILIGAWTLLRALTKPSGITVANCPSALLTVPGGRDPPRRPAVDPGGSGHRQDDDVVLASCLAGDRGRGAGADPAADLHAAGGAGDAATCAFTGSDPVRLARRSRRHVSLGRPPIR